MTPQQLVKLGQLTGVAAAVLYQIVWSSRKETKAYKKALASSHAQTMYLAKIIDDNNIELTEFDLIALSNL